MPAATPAGHAVLAAARSAVQLAAGLDAVAGAGMSAGGRVGDPVMHGTDTDLTLHGVQALTDPSILL